MSQSSTPTLDFKRGDDFRLDLTVQDTNNSAALAQAQVILDEQATLAELQEQDPQDPVAIAAQEAVITAAQAAYDALIIVDITGWTITSQARRGGTLISDFTVTVTDASTGQFTISLDNSETINWPFAVLEVDIEFLRTVGKTSSQTFHINVIRDVTR